VSAGDTVFTIDQVNALIPRLDALVAKLQAHARALQVEREVVSSDGGAPPSMTALLRARPAARRLVEEMEAAANEIAGLGGRLKDLSLGLVDFPGRQDGEPVLLCWQYGEPEVAFWHRDDEGFAGRKPLPGARRAPHLQ
jgi:hypothetical protein